MSSVKCVGAIAAAGAVITGGVSLYRGAKARKRIIESAQNIANANGGKIPTGGMTPDGKMWDGFTTVDSVKNDTKKSVALSTVLSTAFGAVISGTVAAATLLLKTHIK